MPKFQELPQNTQSQILGYLETNNFPAAKEIYDQYKNSVLSKLNSNEGLYQH